MRIENRALAVALGLFGGLCLVGACGGDDSEDKAVTTGVARNKQLADMTSSEASQACDRLQAGFAQVVTHDVLVRTICTLVGAATTDSAADCITERDDCLQKAGDPQTDTAMAIATNAPDFDCGDGSVLSACTATVGQLETCFNETLDSLDTALRSVSCDDAPTLELSDLDGMTEAMFQPAASCAEIDCPNDPFGPSGQ